MRSYTYIRVELTINQSANLNKHKTRHIIRNIQFIKYITWTTNIHTTQLVVPKVMWSVTQLYQRLEHWSKTHNTALTILFIKEEKEILKVNKPFIKILMYTYMYEERERERKRDTENKRKKEREADSKMITSMYQSSNRVSGSLL